MLKYVNIILLVNARIFFSNVCFCFNVQHFYFKNLLCIYTSKNFTFTFECFYSMLIILFFPKFHQQKQTREIVNKQLPLHLVFAIRAHFTQIDFDLFQISIPTAHATTIFLLTVPPSTHTHTFKCIVVLSPFLDHTHFHLSHTDFIKLEVNHCVVLLLNQH